MDPRPPLTTRVIRFFGHGGGVAWYLIGGMLLMTAASTWLVVDTMVGVRFRRDGDALRGHGQIVIPAQAVHAARAMLLRGNEPSGAGP